MSEWIDCKLCGQNHENQTACPAPLVRQPEEEKIMTKFGEWPPNETCDECGVNTLALLKERDTLKAELNEANGKLSKLSRMIDIAGQANDAASEAEVANSATFAEAFAHTNTEIVEQERDALKAQLSDAIKRIHSIDGKLMGCQKERDQVRGELEKRVESMRIAESRLTEFNTAVKKLASLFGEEPYSWQRIFQNVERLEQDRDQWREIARSLVKVSEWQFSESCTCDKCVILARFTALEKGAE